MSAIVVGDLVMVKQFHCEANRARFDGKIFRVKFLRPTSGAAVECGECGAKILDWHPAWARDGCRFMWPVEWLRRIPPLAELETIETRVEMPA